jgi:t-SNARE complex subunit (syntaxin)
MNKEACWVGIFISFLVLFLDWCSDNIESNISSVAVDTGRASEELRTAHEYQRRAGRRAACLMIVLVIVVAIVLLAV